MAEKVRHDFVERRAAARFSLVMRTAKLISLDGEYVCIVRDVSQTGVKLRLFHEPPPGKFVFLELANGDVYPMEHIWYRDNHAGFRFASPVEVDHFVEEPSDFTRRAIRLRISRPADLVAAGREHRGYVLNLSQQGACIELTCQLPVRQAVWFEMAGLPERFSHVCWRRGNRHGLVFQNAFPLDEFAAHAYALQPFTVGHQGDEEPDRRYA